MRLTLIAVDTHVHRITNRWGLATRPPKQTMAALREKLPVAYWVEINVLPGVGLSYGSLTVER